MNRKLLVIVALMLMAGGGYGALPPSWVADTLMARDAHPSASDEWHSDAWYSGESCPEG